MVLATPIPGFDPTAENIRDHQEETEEVEINLAARKKHREELMMKTTMSGLPPIKPRSTTMEDPEKIEQIGSELIQVQQNEQEEDKDNEIENEEEEKEEEKEESEEEEVTETEGKVNDDDINSRKR